MTAQSTIKLLSAIATSLDGILVYGDRIKDIGIPPELAHSWPLIFIGIVAVDRGLHAFLGDPAPAVAGIPTTDQLKGRLVGYPQAAPANTTGALPDPQTFRQPLGQPGAGE